MGNAVAHIVNIVQLKKDSRVVYAILGSCARLVRKDIEQTPTAQTVLHIIEHIFPYAKLHL